MQANSEPETIDNLEKIRTNFSFKGEKWMGWLYGTW
jgi:hypothetical protein